MRRRSFRQRKADRRRHGEKDLGDGRNNHADCAAAPALLYANMAVPFGDAYRNTAAYLDRLKKRAAFARALKEAEPYFKFVPA